MRGRMRWAGLFGAATLVAACSQPTSTGGGAAVDVALAVDIPVFDPDTADDDALPSDATAGDADATADDVADVTDAAIDAGDVDLGDVDADDAADAAADDAADAVTDAATDAAIDAAATDAADADTDAATDAATDADAADGAADTTGDATSTDVTTDAANDTTATKASGCSDGSREGFVDPGVYPLVAACQGAWTVPGIHHGVPACGRKAGNDGVNAAGTGCNVEDLCADGFHVCYGAKDLLDRNPKGCGEIMAGAPAGPAFFLARTSSTGAFNCSQDSTKFGAPGTSNDLFGCGSLGCGLDFKTYPTCDPLHKASHDLCKGLRNDKNCGDWCAHLGKFPGEPNVWDCGSKTTDEANQVIKSDPTRQGGVLCCSDSVL